MIIFENIYTKETYGISQATEGKFYKAKLSALINSSNMSINADRGQDFGVRLIPLQQALIEKWEADPQMIEAVSKMSGVMIDDLTHADFLSYLLRQQELGESPEKQEKSDQREAQRAYEARVEALKVGKVEAMAPFNPKIARGEATIEDFMNGDLDSDQAIVVDSVDVSDDGKEITVGAQTLTLVSPLTPQQKANATKKLNAAAKVSEK